MFSRRSFFLLNYIQKKTNNRELLEVGEPLLRRTFSLFFVTNGVLLCTHTIKPFFLERLQM